MPEDPTTPPPEPGDDTSPKSRRFTRFLPRRVPTTLASKRIPLEDENHQALSKEEKEELLEQTHASWDEAGRPQKARSDWPYFTMLLFVALLGLGVYFLNDKTEEEPPVAEPTPAELAQFDEDRGKKLIAAAVKTFSESEDIAEILGLIRYPDSIAPKVAAYYAENPPTRKAVRNVSTDTNSTLHSDLGSLLMRTTVTFDDFSERTAVVEWRPGEAKIDWEHWVHYNPVPVAEFIDPSHQPAVAEHEFRLAGRKPKEHRPSAQFPEELYASFLLWDEKHHGDEFTAYVQRDTPTYQKLAAYLIETTPRALIVRLRRHPSDGETAIEITAFITDGWVRSRW